MAYNPTTWVEGQTTLGPTNLNKMEQGIAGAHTALENHLADQVGAHPASAISNTPAGGISATDVQGAINELDVEKVSKSGDAMTGPLTVGSSSMAVDNPNMGNTHYWIRVQGENKGLLYWDSSLQRLTLRLYNADGSYRDLHILSDGTVHIAHGSIRIGTILIRGNSGTPEWSDDNGETWSQFGVPESRVIALAMIL